MLVTLGNASVRSDVSPGARQLTSLTSALSGATYIERNIANGFGSRLDEASDVTGVNFTSSAVRSVLTSPMSTVAEPPALNFRFSERGDVATVIEAMSTNGRTRGSIGPI